MRIDAYNQIAQVYKTTDLVFWQRLSDRKTGSH